MLFIKGKNKEGAKGTDNFQLIEIGINVTDEEQESSVINEWLFHSPCSKRSAKFKWQRLFVSYWKNAYRKIVRVVLVHQ
ncbi:hypothetical protein P4646_12425 [Peribacillus simplex]|uniref:hypothetical protein n=1 Tax=Peribacillus simplex TaxID=1478 RepID=UPI0011DD5A34|nr:hypothetical protein [Peribacillus simplex]MED3911350.1 hypothetical protein [Peribacillus simplex]MED3984845.1 hypothetical protein [Peribacillus simplex]MED4095634.1 hypothetical protein [Peribacillus simplex]